jgi:excinuclease ABC subunit B
MDPQIEVKPATHQVDDLLEEIRIRTERKERVLVTTLTKRMAEDLTGYYSDLGVKAKYLHSDIATLERIEIVRNLRLGTFDVLIGVNLLREGLDLPEVSLVAILDADKEGFLRSAQALIQTCGRAARNLNGTVIMYGDLVTNSMKTALKETNRRRKIQSEYNRKNKITPEGIKKDIRNVLASIYESDYLTAPAVAEPIKEYRAIKDIPKEIEKLKKQMREAAQQLEFEQAAELRDRIKKLEEMELSLG